MARARRKRLKKKKAEKKIILVVVLLIVLGSGLRLYGLGKKSLWLDEAFTAMITSRDLPYIIDYTLRDRGPLPLTYIFPWIAQQLVGKNDEFTLRFFDFLFGAVGLVAFFFLARQIQNSPLCIVISVFLVVFSSFHHYYSQEARGYTAVVLLSILQFAFLWKAIWEKEKRPHLWILYYLTLTLSFYFSMFTLLVVVANVLLVGLSLFVIDSGTLSLKEKKTKAVTFGIVTLLIILSCGYWLIFSLPLVSKYKVSAEKLPVLRTLAFLWHAFSAITVGNPIATLAFLGLILAGFAVVPRPLIPILLYPFLIMLTAFLVFQLSPITPAFLHSRYLTPALPFFLLAFSLSLVRLKEKITSPSLYIMLLIIILGGYFIFSFSNIRRNFITEKQNWRDAGKFIAQHFKPGDIIFGGTNNCSVVLFYYLPPQLRPFLSPDVPSTVELERWLKQGKRVWFATAYYRWYYPWRGKPAGTPQAKLYYDWLDAHFSLMKEFPGEYPVKVFLSK